MHKRLLTFILAVSCLLTARAADAVLPLIQNVDAYEGTVWFKRSFQIENGQLKIQLRRPIFNFQSSIFNPTERCSTSEP